MSKNKDGLEAGKTVDFDTWRKVENERKQSKPEAKPSAKTEKSS